MSSTFLRNCGIYPDLSLKPEEEPHLVREISAGVALVYAVGFFTLAITAALAIGSLFALVGVI